MNVSLPHGMQEVRGSNPRSSTHYMCRSEGVSDVSSGAVRAENLIRGCDQQSCHPYRPAVMITDHVPAVRLPPDYADGIVAAAVPARGSMADRRDPAPAPPADRPATSAAAPPEPELGGQGPDRVAARCDTESAPPGAAAAGHPGHDPALAPRHRPPPPGR